MTRNEYINELRRALDNNNIANFDEIVEKYEKRFDLGLEAGLSIDEIITMLGSVEDVVLMYLSKKVDLKDTDFAFDVENERRYSLHIKTNIADIDITRGRKEGIVISMDNQTSNYVRVKNNDHKISIEDMSVKNLNFRGGKKIKIEVGDEVVFDEISISTTTRDFDMCSLTIKEFNYKTVSGDASIDKLTTKQVKLYTVSGDIDIDKLLCDGVKMSTVSGDIDIDYMEANDAFISTVSGDINITGKCNNKKCQCISGDINYRDVK